MKRYAVRVHPDVAATDLKSLPRDEQERIVRAMEERLTLDPIRFGAALRRDLKGHRKLRVGDRRIVYRVVGREVQVLGVGHRSEIYEWIGRRLRWPA